MGRGSTLPVAQARKRDQLPAEGRPEDRRPTRRNGEGSSNGLTRSRPTRRPKNEAAKERLTGLYAELEQINRKADNSLMEGLEETLTLHRLGLFEELGRSLKTTNCIENLNEQVEGYTGNAKRWPHSPQRHRWTRQLHLGPGPDGAPIQGGVFVLPRALSPAPFGQFR